MNWIGPCWSGLFRNAYLWCTLTLVGLSCFPLDAVENKRVRVQIIGAPSRQLQKHMVASTSIPPYRRDHQYWQRSDLRRAIQDEVPRWLRVMHAYGYFDAQLRVAIRETAYSWVIELSVAPGPQYNLNHVTLYLQQGSNIHLTALPVNIDLPQASTVKTINEIERKLLSYYKNAGFAQAAFVSKQLEINTIDKTARVVWTFDPGLFYIFGPLEITGLDRLHKQFIMRKVLFREGIPYNQELVDQTQGSLETSPQFDACATTVDWSRAENQVLPMTIALSEAKRRTIAFGATLVTDAGVGGRFLWENRNLTGEGDLLALRGYHSKRQNTGSIVYNRPDFFANQTDLRIQLEFNDEQTKSYTTHNWQTGAFFERRLNRRLFFSYGASLQYIETFKTSLNSKTSLLSFPFTATWSNSTNPLNPMDGRSHQIQITPYLGFKEPIAQFTKLILKNGFYFPLSEWLTLAFGIQGGSILGAVLNDIPPPLRFFEGGSSAFRGYSYKTVSPLDAAKNPFGGRSYILFSIEPRLRLSNDFTLVPFYEIGRVYAREGPNLGSGYLRSAGFGLGYDTMIGPIRFDFAVPMNRRKGTDPHFQIYLNVGPTF